MDKFFGNSSKDNQDFIEKFRIEVDKNSEEDFINTRKLTVQKNDIPNESTHDIDRQITDLENLIKRLQDEIAEMSNNADKPLEEYEPVEHKEHDVKNLEMKDIENRPDTTSQVYPVIIRDVDLTLLDQSQEFANTLAELINSNDDVSETFSDIRKTFSKLWNDEESEDPEDDDKTEKKGDKINEMIDELKAEISEKLETLKDVNIDEASEDS